MTSILHSRRSDPLPSAHSTATTELTYCDLVGSAEQPPQANIKIKLASQARTGYRRGLLVETSENSMVDSPTHPVKRLHRVGPGRPDSPVDKEKLERKPPVEGGR